MCKLLHMLSKARQAEGSKGGRSWQMLSSIIRCLSSVCETTSNSTSPWTTQKLRVFCQSYSHKLHTTAYLFIHSGENLSYRGISLAKSLKSPLSSGTCYHVTSLRCQPALPRTTMQSALSSESLPSDSLRRATCNDCRGERPTRRQHHELRDVRQLHRSSKTQAVATYKCI